MTEDKFTIKETMRNHRPLKAKLFTCTYLSNADSSHFSVPKVTHSTIMQSYKERKVASDVEEAAQEFGLYWKNEMQQLKTAANQ